MSLRLRSEANTRSNLQAPKCGQEGDSQSVSQPRASRFRGRPGRGSVSSRGPARGLLPRRVRVAETREGREALARRRSLGERGPSPESALSTQPHE